MQKKIIALAVAALASGAALAQSNVTVYGVMDVQQAVVKSSAGTTAAGAAVSGQSSVGRLDSNSSYIGFKGTEDLGNGLKALFQYEVGFTGDTGVIGTTNTLATRDAFVGLTGGFGTVVAGNLTHPLRAMGAKVELAPAAAGFGTMAAVTGQIGGIQTGADNRANNAIAYVSPNFSGFTATVAYVNGENKTSTNTVAVTGAGTVASPAVAAGAGNGVNQKAWQVAGQYENGPLWVAAGYHKAYDFGITAAAGVLDPTVATTNLTEDGQDARVWRLAGVYTLPTVTKLTALYDDTKVKLGSTASAALGIDYVKRAAWSLGVAQSFGKNTVGLEYGQAGKLKSNAGSADETKANILTAVYSYELSKRTMLQARYSKLTNKEEANYGFYLNGVTGNGGTSGFGSDYTGFMAGIRHNF